MIALTSFGGFSVAFGLLFGNGPEVVLGLIAIGMAVAGAFAHAMRRDWRKNHELLHGRRRA